MNKTNIKDKLLQYTGDLGVGVMTLATVVGMLELNDHATNRYILPGQLVRVQEANDLGTLNNPLTREKQEATQEYISYAESQRTPSRSGRY